MPELIQQPPSTPTLLSVRLSFTWSESGRRMLWIRSKGIGLLIAAVPENREQQAERRFLCLWCQWCLGWAKGGTAYENCVIWLCSGYIELGLWMLLIQLLLRGHFLPSLKFDCRIGSGAWKWSWRDILIHCVGPLRAAYHMILSSLLPS